MNTAVASVGGWVWPQVEVTDPARFRGARAPVTGTLYTIEVRAVPFVVDIDPGASVALDTDSSIPAPAAGLDPAVPYVNDHANSPGGVTDATRPAPS